MSEEKPDKKKFVVGMIGANHTGKMAFLEKIIATSKEKGITVTVWDRKGHPPVPPLPQFIVLDEMRILRPIPDNDLPILPLKGLEDRYPQFPTAPLPDSIQTSLHTYITDFSVDSSKDPDPISGEKQRGTNKTPKKKKKRKK